MGSSYGEKSSWQSEGVAYVRSHLIKEFYGKTKVCLYKRKILQAKKDFTFRNPRPRWYVFVPSQIGPPFLGIYWHILSHLGCWLVRLCDFSIWSQITTLESPELFQFCYLIQHLLILSTLVRYSLRFFQAHWCYNNKATESISLMPRNTVVISLTKKKEVIAHPLLT